MATLYHAQLHPTKLELLSDWVPTQPWARDVDVSHLESAGAYRFDDPAGEVGVETHLLSSTDGQILQVPLTYRAKELDEAASSLITTMDHSVLGKRWVYDASVDPVYATALATAMLLGGAQAERNFVTDDGFETSPATTLVRGSGSSAQSVSELRDVSFRHDGNATVIIGSGLELRVLRVIAESSEDSVDVDATLSGCWPDHDVWVLLASVKATDCS